MQRVPVKLIVSEHLFYLLKSVTYVLSHYTFYEILQGTIQLW